MKIRLKRLTIEEVCKGYEDKSLTEEGVFSYDGKLDIRPKYQRNSIYEPEQKKAVINTIIKGFPLNVMYWVEKPDGTEKKFGNKSWFTNLDNEVRHKKLILLQDYNIEDYQKYDNYNAIDIGKYNKNGIWKADINYIPAFYTGYMGVPITFIDKYNPEQFDIIGILQSSTEEEAGIPILRTYNDFKEMTQDMEYTGASGGKANGNPVLKGKSEKGNFLYNEETDEYVHSAYARILIKRKDLK